MLIYLYSRWCLDSYRHVHCALSFSDGLLCLLVLESVVFSVVETFMMIIRWFLFPRVSPLSQPLVNMLAFLPSRVEWISWIRLCKWHYQCCKHEILFGLHPTETQWGGRTGEGVAEACLGSCCFFFFFSLQVLQRSLGSTKYLSFFQTVSHFWKAESGWVSYL